MSAETGGDAKRLAGSEGVQQLPEGEGLEVGGGGPTQGLVGEDEDVVGIFERDDWNRATFGKGCRFVVGGWPGGDVVHVTFSWEEFRLVPDLGFGGVDSRRTNLGVSWTGKGSTDAMIRRRGMDQPG